ncbi:hypothetical protein [Gynuella sunshinyii]|uniref:Uncharacterized protein n=1 Tax=Gynuella sunshinyii YC6258 TaxID=1445510 RepID=A0A0C5VPD7_9GAMM|nr:hypothetical protein [Gynuella sunshinyii]AJQ96126.1 hypothetical Protein YC6258_04090 [Gynuella sunshinyii YC6258]
MRQTLNIDQLVQSEGDVFEDQFIWIDWRASEQDVVGAFSEQLVHGQSFEYLVTKYDASICYQGQTFPVPLTHTGSDRYVVISSLAEILKSSYEVWQHKDSLENDTHGFLLLTVEQSQYLQREYPEWTDTNLCLLEKGFDFFNDLNIPYFNHADDTLFRQQYEAAVAARQATFQKSWRTSSQVKTQTFSFKKYSLLLLKGLLLVAAVYGLYLKYHDSQCRVRVDGHCIAYQE